MISLNCPNCAHTTHSDRLDLFGKRVKCPKCRQPFTVPAELIGAASTPKSAAAEKAMPTSVEKVTLASATQTSNGKPLRLDLLIRDHEVASELQKHSEGDSRNEFALAALRIGLLALRQAGGIVDSQVLRHEGDRLLDALRDTMNGTATHFHDVLGTTLKKYFDPNDGDLRNRLDQLLKKDGELQSVLALHLDGNESVIARTLARHVGEQSPIFRMLSPTQSDGILASITEAIRQALLGQREHILKQFSLDDRESALSRLVAEMRGENGRLRSDLSTDLGKMANEFSLDNPGGALSRLVGYIDKSQKSIAEQFSRDNDQSALSHMSKLIESANDSIRSCLTLDDEKSPLNRLRRELLGVIDGIEKGNNGFQKEVLSTLESFKARREEMQRSTRHGGEFEDAVSAFVQDDAQKRGDEFEATGGKTGSKPYCKIGDCVLMLGQESAAPGIRIVCEAKEDKSYDLVAARKEIDEARRNRDAQIGIFVFSRATAPSGLEPFARYGMDLVVVWDKEDLGTDLFLRAALSVARALAIREKIAGERVKVGSAKVKQALIVLEKDRDGLEEILKWTGTIQNNSQKILRKLESVQADLDGQISALGEHLGELEQADASQDGAS
jgi:hypothetical protein